MPTFSHEQLVLRLQQALRLEDVPAPRLQAVLDLAKARSKVEEPGAAGQLSAVGLSALRVVRAVLGFDSWAQAPLAMGMRAVTSTPRQAPRQYLFRAEDLDVDVRVGRTAKAYAISGQVLGREATGAVLLRRTEQGEDVAAEAPLDEFGEFHLGEVQAGRYGLELRLDDRIVAVPGLAVGEEAGGEERGGP